MHNPRMHNPRIKNSEKAAWTTLKRNVTKCCQFIYYREGMICDSTDAAGVRGMKERFIYGS